MNETQLELTRLLGDKTISFGCLVEWDNGMSVSKRQIQAIDSLHLLGYWDSAKDMYQEAFWTSELFLRDCEIIGHPATLTDLHRWMNNNCHEQVPNGWVQHCSSIMLTTEDWIPHSVDYDSSKPLLDQSPETLSAIINLVKSYGK